MVVKVINTTQSAYFIGVVAVAEEEEVEEGCVWGLSSASGNEPLSPPLPPSSIAFFLIP
jgi:hypothetical protein